MAGIDYTTKSVPVQFPKISGGLNSSFSPLALLDSESSDCQNIDFNKSGSIIKRNGYARLNTSAFNSGATFNGLHWLELSTGTDFLVGVAGNKIAKMDSLDGTWDDITGGITITAGDDNHVSSRTFLDNYIATNNVDVPFLWTGSGNAAAMTVVTGLTKAKFIEVYSSYTLMANCTVSGTTHPTRIYWSTINTIDTWAAADFNDVSRNDGQEITGTAVLGEELIIFKERSIHKALFTGDRDIPFQFVKTRSHVGCIAPFSIQEVNNGLVFLAADGYYFFDGNNSFKLSDRITTTLDTYRKSRFANVSSVYYPTKNRYYSSQSTSGASQHDRVITWDSFNNSFSPYVGFDPNVWVKVNTSGEERIYFGDYAGFVYRADNGTSDNPSGTKTAIDAFWYSKWISYEDLVSKKGTPHVYIYHQINTTTLTLSYSYDFESADSFSQTFTLSGGSDLYGTGVYGTATYSGVGGNSVRRDLTGRGRVIRIKFKNSTVDEEFQIDGFGTLPHLETSN